MLIPARIEARIWQYLGGIARECTCEALRIGGVDNHVHLLLRIPANVSVSKIVQTIKGNSSKWINDQGLTNAPFAWQTGYGAFTVSQSNIPAVYSYIDTQREHHRAHSFEDEYRSLLQKHGVDFDEKHALGLA